MRQNLLFITTDQQRFDTLGAYGFDKAITPNIDRLCNEGTVFEKCYVTAPVCVASRSSMLTGLYPSVTGTLGNSGWLEDYIPRWPREASESGYRTVGIGKMHFSPWDALSGFDERIICEDKRHYYIPDDHYMFLEKNGLKRPCPVSFPMYHETCGAPFYPYSNEYYPDTFIADQAVKWLENNGTAPFAAWVSFVGPHDPYDPPEEYKDLYSIHDMPEPIPPPSDPESKTGYMLMNKERPGKNSSVFQCDYMAATVKQQRYWWKNYMTNLTIIDEGIGRIFKHLDDNNLWDNTTIVFTSDHGDALGDHGMVFKTLFYECMARVPLIVKGKDVPRGERRANLVSVNDLTEYFLEVLNLKPFKAGQGISISKALQNPDEVLHDAVFSEMNGRYMVFDGRYKLCYYVGHKHELYDLKTDPKELTNRIDDPALAEELKRLLSLLMRHMDDCNEKRTMLSEKTACKKRIEIDKAYKEGRCILNY